MHRRALPDPSGSASPEPSSSPAPEEPSPSPTTSPVPAAPVKNINWYLDHVPDFPKAPKPVPIDVPKGDSTPWWKRVPVPDGHKVAFITIDDGGAARTTEARQLIERADIPVTLFLNSPAAEKYTSYFKSILATGAHAQDHTVTHRNLKGQSYDFQYKEIKDCADKLEAIFGERPYLFRPPFGNYDSTTLKAARDNGMRVSFFWTQTVDAGIVRYQTSKKEVKPGDVLLMHFRPALADDLIGALTAIKESGLIPARLEDYLPRLA
jgi:peptidoglycan/xylan/chitin deacetylase (PgdA/CDA1 family)